MHWNFFLTLTVITLFGSLARRIFGVERLGILGIVIVGIHQLVLSTSPSLTAYLLSNDVKRATFIDMNKEGLFGCFGKPKY